MKDLYSVLGIDVNASATDIREAYRKLSKKFHPDLNENDPYFENRFKEIRDAYELLSDPIGRAAYDNQLKKFREYPVPSADPKKPTGKSSVNTKINWAFTAMLFLLFTLFAYYVVRSVTHTKPVKMASVNTATTASLTTHHKRHRHKKAAPQIADAKSQLKSTPYVDTISARTIKPSISRVLTPAIAIAEKPKPVSASTITKPAVTVNQPKPFAPVSTTVVSASPAQNAAVMQSPARPLQQNQTAVLADAYIKANATGIVYMRQLNNYNADVVGVIPGDSKVTVLEKGGNFYKVSYNNKTGYVPNWTVQFR